MLIFDPRGEAAMIRRSAVLALLFAGAFSAVARGETELTVQLTQISEQKAVFASVESVDVTPGRGRGSLVWYATWWLTRAAWSSAASAWPWWSTPNSSLAWRHSMPAWLRWRGPSRLGRDGAQAGSAAAPFRQRQPGPPRRGGGQPRCPQGRHSGPAGGARRAGAAPHRGCGAGAGRRPRAARGADQRQRRHARSRSASGCPNRSSRRDPGC